MNATLVKNEVTPRPDSLRLETLERYEIPRTAPGPAPDPALDDLAELAAKACNTPVAGVSFAAAGRIYIHARYGLSETELPLGTLPHEPPARTHGVYEIPDTRAHPDFQPGGIFLSGRNFR